MKKKNILFTVQVRRSSHSFHTLQNGVTPRAQSATFVQLFIQIRRFGSAVYTWVVVVEKET